MKEHMIKMKLNKMALSFVRYELYSLLMTYKEITECVNVKIKSNIFRKKRK